MNSTAEARGNKTRDEVCSDVSDATDVLFDATYNYDPALMDHENGDLKPAYYDKIRKVAAGVVTKTRTAANQARDKAVKADFLSYADEVEQKLVKPKKINGGDLGIWNDYTAYC